MEEERKFILKPGVLGMIISVMLIVSRFLGFSALMELKSLNTVLVIIMLVLCVHLVRVTSALRQPNVWNAKDTLFLFLLPIAMLAVTLIQLIMEPPAFITSRVFSAVLIFLSLPVFFICYFLYLSGRLPQNKTLKEFSRILLGTGIVYVVLRLLDDVCLPLIENLSGREIAPVLYKITGSNTYLSFMISILSLAGFIVLFCEYEAPKRSDR